MAHGIYPFSMTSTLCNCKIHFPLLYFKTTRFSSKFVFCENSCKHYFIEVPCLQMNGSYLVRKTTPKGILGSSPKEKYKIIYFATTLTQT